MNTCFTEFLQIAYICRERFFGELALKEEAVGLYSFVQIQYTTFC